MGRSVRLFLFAVLLMLSMPAAVESAWAACPQKIAFVDDSALTRGTASRLKAVYDRIGCPDVALIGLPGRRGVVAFNAGEVQGELMRLPTIETEYTRPFLRVAMPLTHVTGRLWAREARHAEAGATGYVLGVVWQEQYAQQHGGTGFHGQAEMLRAYASGLIDRFLGEDAAVDRAVQDGRLPARPAYAGQPLVSAGLHHYLGVEFAAAAAAVTAELERLGQDGSGTEIQ